MAPKVTPPFGTYPPKVCKNPDCKTGPGNTRANFTPETPWQECCCPTCRMHAAYLDRKAKKPPAVRRPGRPKKSVEKSDESDRENSSGS